MDDADVDLVFVNFAWMDRFWAKGKCTKGTVMVPLNMFHHFSLLMATLVCPEDHVILLMSPMARLAGSACPFYHDQAIVVASGQRPCSCEMDSLSGDCAVHDMPQNGIEFPNYTPLKQ